ncbi:hypothetical protein PL8927_110034 [Planktothrix serta PCC 8927]|uniref:Uncharacterized protein n=1 Tax=Planktothrix serta PCC 8927 TaxID=671068 RepID=A0A1J1JMX5_9CYAN|nr:hypothetical protein PL8927_110034 [Planktothrix serta PCC 8927]VXD10542.1 hypothetical protein PL8927_110034 [Planktothrix serta PCC 8927]
MAIYKNKLILNNLFSFVLLKDYEINGYTSGQILVGWGCN